ncbi:hypothetical protein KY318_03195, partial [Candidatus Woesearchaeota archaeon]|nr:hypothetical protein [Candidatus Woesearchaeota archaeon]
MNEGYKTTQEGSTDLGSIGTLAPNQRQLERELERSMESLGLKRDGSARSVLEAERTYRRAIEEATMSGKPLADALLRASYRVGITSPHRQKQKLRKQVEAVRSQLVTVERKYQGALDQVVRDYEKILQDQDEAITARENAKRLMALL